MGKKLSWHNDKIKLRDLKGFKYNPRNLTEKQHKELKESLEKFNLVEVPAVDTDNTLVAGHQRTKVMIELYGLDHEIDIRKPNRKLTEKEFEEYLIRSNKNTGSWDMEKLANHFDMNDLVEWGFTESELEINIPELKNLSDENIDNEKDTEHGDSKLVECPECGFSFDG